MVIMTHAYEQLSRTARRRLVRRALLRPTLSAAVLFVLYFALPLDRGFSATTAVVLLVALCVLGGLVVLQARAIVRSRYPRLTAITALAFSIPLFVLLFASAYFLIAQTASNAFSEPMTRLDALYFTVTVLATVGFGDIAARSELARALTTVQMAADLLLIGLLVRVLLGAVQTGLASRAGSGQDDPPKQSETDT
jgi:voltage-gated potassium channel